MAELEPFERKLWNVHEKSKLTAFRDLLEQGGLDVSNLHAATSRLDVEKSGLDSDEARYEQQALELRQAGYSTMEKKLESLKQGGKGKSVHSLTNVLINQFLSRL